MFRIKEGSIGLIGIFMVALWIVFSSVSLNVGLHTYKLLPEVRSLNADEKKIMADGPIYLLASEARRKIALTESVYFFNAHGGESTDGRYNQSKIKYYLGPRRLAVAYPVDFDLNEAAKYNYLITTIPEANNPQAFDRMVMGSGNFIKLYHRMVDGEHQLLYSSRALGSAGER